ncbi:unnamed protein product [Clavelina lepadiformis]|uniref:Uncharacterized protein n=1 Tax=Clavelina lepadiformis TaxID=159417 RepID=A0ABP0GDA7_CLALP
MAECYKTKKLVLRGNNLGDYGASHISTCLSKIEELHIGECKISAFGIKSISDAISKLPEPVTAFNVTMFDSLIDCRPGSPKSYLYALNLSTMGPDVFYFNAVVLK